VFLLTESTDKLWHFGSHFKVPFFSLDYYEISIKKDSKNYGILKTIYVCSCIVKKTKYPCIDFLSFLPSLPSYIIYLSPYYTLIYFYSAVMISSETNSYTFPTYLLAKLLPTNS